MFRRTVWPGSRSGLPGWTGWSSLVTELRVPSLEELDVRGADALRHDPNAWWNGLTIEERHLALDRLRGEELELCLRVLQVAVRMGDEGLTRDAPPRRIVTRVLVRSMRRDELGLGKDDMRTGSSSASRRGSTWAAACVRGVDGCRCLDGVLDDPALALSDRRTVLVVACRRHGVVVRRRPSGAARRRRARELEAERVAKALKEAERLEAVEKRRQARAWELPSRVERSGTVAPVVPIRAMRVSRDRSGDLDRVVQQVAALTGAEVHVAPDTRPPWAR